MGHNRLRRLRKTQRWEQVVELLYSGEDLPAVVAASLEAVESSLGQVSADISFTSALTNIFKFIECARSDDFEASLRKNGFVIGDSPTLFDITSSLNEKIDQDLSTLRARSDLSEITQNSFTETLNAYVAPGTVSLFEVTASDVRNSLRRHLRGETFKVLMHEFYSRFTRRYLDYYLSRELPRHVGPGFRFENSKQYREFNRAFDLHVRQTVRIADEFTPQWFSKAEWQDDLSHESVSRYAHVAFKKIADEFRRGAYA